jgi:serine/threonine protein kinase HipA of HipAB toxin-antitoxin module
MDVYRVRIERRVSTLCENKYEEEELFESWLSSMHAHGGAKQEERKEGRKRKSEQNLAIQIFRVDRLPHGTD